ncbi:hypothetical protein ACFQ48_20485 [Hymenobacter caeli]|uniref:Membrane associated rhomboid family serine protease n=1 Tax=Hymenobacter caeli TaxID=2735894 RepID=A0ABX2FW18_9BACT|nr:hypothetical protein [Hymenobacter caeli]NRT21344.1 membrane associated rhomboid family serine protease [Hymenobacter caeli]
MPYFFILPVFVVGLLLPLAAGVVLRFTRWRNAAPYVFGVAVGAALGFAGANALLLPLLHGVNKLPATQNAQTIKTLLLAVVVFIGPFVASAAGAVVGAIVGIVAAWRIGRR